MTSEDCRQFDSCSAPLCPWDESSLKHGIWYPDEDICIKLSIPWIKQQRKIKKKVTEIRRYFTYLMLKQKCRINAGTLGLDPESPRDERDREEKAWIKKHPNLTFSETQIENSRKQGEIMAKAMKKQAVEAGITSGKASRGVDECL